MNKERPIIFNAQMVQAILASEKTQTRRVVKPQPISINDDFDGTWEWKEEGHYYDDLTLADMLRRHCPYGTPIGLCLDDAGEWRRGMPPCDGWYYVKGFSEDRPVWLSRFLPSDYPGEDVEPGLLWSWSQHDSPEAIEVEGLSLQTIEWQRPTGDHLWVRETWSPLQDPESCWRADEACEVAYRADDGWVENEPESREQLLNGKWRPSIFMPRWASRITLEITDVRVERVQDIAWEDAIAEGVSTANIDEHQAFCYDEIIARFVSLWDSINEKRGFGWDMNPWCWCISFVRA